MAAKWTRQGISPAADRCTRTTATSLRPPALARRMLDLIDRRALRRHHLQRRRLRLAPASVLRICSATIPRTRTGRVRGTRMLRDISEWLVEIGFRPPQAFPFEQRGHGDVSRVLSPRARPEGLAPAARRARVPPRRLARGAARGRVVLRRGGHLRHHAARTGGGAAHAKARATSRRPARRSWRRQIPGATCSSRAVSTQSGESATVRPPRHAPGARVSCGVRGRAA